MESVASAVGLVGSVTKAVLSVATAVALAATVGAKEVTVAVSAAVSEGSEATAQLLGARTLRVTEADGALEVVFKVAVHMVPLVVCQVEAERRMRGEFSCIGYL